MEQTNQSNQINEQSKKRGRKSIDPEQLKENSRQSKLRWKENNKQYYKKGNNGYEYMMREVVCSDCQRSVMFANLSRHKKQLFMRNV